MHGPTYMGNALACAAANAALDLFETEPRLAQVAALSAALVEGLEPCRGLPGVRDVRVLGGIGVVELASGTQAAALRGAFLDEGVWVRPFGHIVYLTPAFTIDAGDLARLMAAVQRVVERWSQAFGELP